MIRRSRRHKLEQTRQETNCREKTKRQNMNSTNSRPEQCCGVHGRRLELFCQEDETFICVLCVPRHSSHNFMLLHEAFSIYKDKLKNALTSVESKVQELKNLQKKKAKEIADVQASRL
ncbi:E3 ubiquitin-protein ligase TRIM39-like [Protopterus annectens]|uniref:E3 ubiquitin-protein ligase TRIM39-like n=1 Tax=Protopterus annectens TaxID=7888 RepID=UPI001CFB8030|nr:E3 ubiquitin-protein ligase TRIM39-like [Protopterus annectens]